MKSASTLGWSVTAPETILPPVLKKPIKEMSRADCSFDSPLCCVIWTEAMWKRCFSNKMSNIFSPQEDTCKEYKAPWRLEGWPTSPGRMEGSWRNVIIKRLSIVRQPDDSFEDADITSWPKINNHDHFETFSFTSFIVYKFSNSLEDGDITIFRLFLCSFIV